MVSGSALNPTTVAVQLTGDLIVIRYTYLGQVHLDFSLHACNTKC